MWCRVVSVRVRVCVQNCHQQCALRCLYVPRMKHSPSNLTTSSPDAWPLPSDLPSPTTLMSPRPTQGCTSQSRESPGSLASSARGCPAFLRVQDEVFTEVLVPRHLTGSQRSKQDTRFSLRFRRPSSLPPCTASPLSGTHRCPRSRLPRRSRSAAQLPSFLTSTLVRTR